MNTGGRTDGLSRLVVATPLAILASVALVAAPAAAQEYPLPRPPGPLPQLSPPPLVRIVGGTTVLGARITRLTVRAPVGSTVVSKCISKSRKRCPYTQRVSPVSGSAGTRTVHITGFERTFRAGVVLEIYVVKSNRTGKYTSFTIRQRKTPQRRDRCVTGLTLTPVSCPG